MKKVTLLFSVVLMLSLGYQSYAQCKAKQIVKECKGSIAPYQYDSYALNEINFDPKKPQTIEVEFTAFAGQQYKLVFCTSGFEEAVVLSVYDKSQRSKKRNKLYDGGTGKDKKWSFEPKKAGTYFIDYEIPAAINAQAKKTGCIVMLIGYNE